MGAQARRRQAPSYRVSRVEDNVDSCKMKNVDEESSSKKEINLIQVINALYS